MMLNNNLPFGWRWVRLGEVCELILGQSPPGHTYTDKAQGLPFFQGKVDFGNYFPNTRIWCTKPIKLAEEGDILISVRAPVGPVNMNNLRCCIGRGLTAIRCKSNIINWFVFWYLRNIEEDITALGSGSTFGAITRNDLINLQIPLPPIEEQKRIASKIQELMQKVEQAKAACEKQLEAAKALPAAYLREVFESEEAKKWERKRLGELLLTNPQYGLTATSDKSEKGYIYLRITDITDSGKIKTENLKYIELDDKSFEKYKVFNGDILIARSGSVGRVYLVKESDLPMPAVFASYLIKFKLKSDYILPEYFFYFCLSRQYKSFVSEQIKTVAQPNINAKQYQKLEIPLPPIKTQHLIATDLEEKMSHTENLQSAIYNQLEAINTLPHAILRKAFRGEL